MSNNKNLINVANWSILVIIVALAGLFIFFMYTLIANRCSIEVVHISCAQDPIAIIRQNVLLDRSLEILNKCTEKINEQQDHILQICTHEKSILTYSVAFITIISGILAITGYKSFLEMKSKSIEIAKEIAKDIAKEVAKREAQEQANAVFQNRNMFVLSDEDKQLIKNEIIDDISNALEIPERQRHSDTSLEDEQREMNPEEDNLFEIN